MKCGDFRFEEVEFSREGGREEEHGTVYCMYESDIKTNINFVIVMIITCSSSSGITIFALSRYASIYNNIK